LTRGLVNTGSSMSNSKPDIELTTTERWRLVLGEASQNALGGAGASGHVQQLDQSLSWLYGRSDGRNDGDSDNAERDLLERHGGDGQSNLTVPDWINKIHELFPKETIERLERDAIQRYGIDEIVTNLDVLERAEPNPALLEAVMRTKHLMNPEVLAMARKLVAKVVKELIDKLAKEIQRSFSGTKRRRNLAFTGAMSQFAARETIARNLKHFDVQRSQMVIARPLFYTNTRKVMERWQVFLVVDQSGSMVSSVIHSAVTASCLWGLPGIKTHLIAFDTNVVDLTERVADPVETLMQVQLGGGTYIAKAVKYAADRIEVPTRAIVVIVSDFYEGMPEHHLVSLTQALVAQGTRVLGLAALNDKAEADFDRELAARLVEVGAQVAAMTPGQLAAWLAEKLK
jgi:Mg-chelatase subunit ChlD